MVRSSALLPTTSFPRRVAVLAMAVAILACCGGCDDEDSAVPGADVGFRLVNATGVTVTVTVDGPGFSALQSTLGVGGSTPVEVPAAAGDQITVTATGAPFTAGNGGCTVSQIMINEYPDIYGQINIMEPGAAGQPLEVECGSGW